MWFEAVSGLRINLEKSELIPVGRVENIDDLALDFGCRVGSLPSTYLGLPLGAPFKTVSVQDGVEEQFLKRLAMWKRQYLSKGGGSNTNSKHFVESPYLLYVLAIVTKFSQTKTRVNPKGLSLGWWQLGAKTTLSKMEGGVLK